MGCVSDDADTLQHVGDVLEMSEPNSKRTTPVHSGFEWGGTVARMRRGAKSSRSGRRSALLSVLTSVYVNSTRGTRPADPRAGSDR